MDEQLIALQREYLPQVKDQIEETEDHLESLRDRYNDITYRTFVGLIHSIKGTSGSYEMKLLGTICHTFEDYLNTISFEIINDKQIKNCYSFLDLAHEYVEDFRPLEKFNQDSIKEKLKGLSKLIGTEKKIHKIIISGPSKFLDKAYRQALSEFNISFTSISSPKEVLEKLKTEQFHSLITPYVLPEIKVEDLIEQIRMLPPPNCYLNIILISANPKDPLLFKGHQKPNYILLNSPKIPLEFKNIFDRIFYPYSEGKSITDILAINKEGNKLKKSNSLKKVLFCDDDIAIHALAKIGFSKLDQVEVKYALSANEALKEAKTFKPDMIICDVMMPDVDGREFIAKLKKDNSIKEIPVVFLTGIENELELQDLMDRMASGIMKKPFNLKDFPTLIKDIWLRI